MKTYRVQYIGDVPKGWTHDDVVARVISVVSSLTIIDRAEVRAFEASGTHVRVVAVFQGLNDNEARETARRALLGLPGSWDTVLDRRDQKYTRIPTTV